MVGKIVYIYLLQKKKVFNSSRDGNDEAIYTLNNEYMRPFVTFVRQNLKGGHYSALTIIINQPFHMKYLILFQKN